MLRITGLSLLLGLLFLLAGLALWPWGSSHGLAPSPHRRRAPRAAVLGGDGAGVTQVLDDVLLGVENHDFTTDIDRMLRILEAVDSPWFGLNFDSGNLAKTSDPYADLKRIAPHTVNAQLKIHIPRDGKKEPADFKRIVDILGEAGYRGYLVLEYEAGDPFNEVPHYLD